MLKAIAISYSKRTREKRARIFKEYLSPSENDRILDLGSGDGSYIASIVPFRDNVYIADILPEPLNKGKQRFGFINTVILDESGMLPFPDECFDIVFCSSVIEHVTVDKTDVGLFQSNAGFSEAAYTRQRRFADEIRRVGKRYFVQTPNKYFPIESHTWLPLLIVFLTRPLQIRIIEFLNKWWLKKTSPDWNLLTKAKMQELFPDAEIVLEKAFGLTKSIMAIRR